MCTRQWGLDPREALGVAALGSTTPTCRGPDSRTGIRNIQFLLPEFLLRSLIQPLHRVTTPAQHRLSSLLNHVPTVLILHSLVSSLIGSPDQNCLTTERAALALPHPTVFLGLGHFSSMGWRGVSQPISLSLWERLLSRRFLSPAFPAGQHRHLSCVMPPQDSRTAQEI